MNTPFELNSTERYGSSHTKGHGTTEFLPRGKRGRQKENSKALHQLTRTQPLAGMEIQGLATQLEILSVQKNGKVQPAGHIKCTRDG